MARIIGNAGPGMTPTKSGSGVDRMRSPFARVTIVSDAAGDVIRVPLSALFPKFDQIYQGIFAQAIGGGCQIDVTLCEPDLAVNPAQDGSGSTSHWHADTTLAAGPIQKLVSPIASCLRITFTAKGSFLFLAGV